MNEEVTRQQSKFTYINRANGSKFSHEKTDSLQNFEIQEQNIRKRYAHSKSTQLQKNAKQELDTLLYYVLQRVYYRFNEFFKEAYNPSLFANNRINVALEFALKDILKMHAF